MKFWAGVTDNEWFPFLAARGLDEVNFWRPSPGPYFTGLPAGTPFLFKLKAPNNHIAGGGFFVQYSSLPLEMAWDAFGEKNGMPTFRDFDRKIREYRKLPKGPLEMGCNVLVQPFFFPRERWIELPTWPKAVVAGKTFDTETTEGTWLWNEVQVRLQDHAVQDLVAEPAAEYGGPRYGELFLTRSRLGQGAFRVLVSEAYSKRCAITGESTFPVLEAAHIRPYELEGPHRISRRHPKVAFGSEREGFRDQARREVLSVAAGYVIDEQRSMGVKDPRAARRVTLGWRPRHVAALRLP